MARVVYDFYMTQAASALEIAYDSRKRKSYRLNRPLVFFFFFFLLIFISFLIFILILCTPIFGLLRGNSVDYDFRHNFHTNTIHFEFWPNFCRGTVQSDFWPNFHPYIIH